MQERYFDALAREIDTRGGGESVDTVYLGGGTPSRSRVEHLERVVSGLQRAFNVAPLEFSMEANPEDVTAEALVAWRALGVNRLSIGVQSFHDRELRPLGRVHGADVARRAIALAVASGIRTSIDLILGLPHQTEESFLTTLEIAIALGVGHISIYMLDLEDGSALERQVTSGAVALPDDEIIASLYHMAIDRLSTAGFAQYEISNFAREGEQCRHNLHYWRREPYFGLGLGAHSFIGERRFANTRDLARYIASPGEPEFVEELTAREQKRETIFLRLRTPAGLDYGEVLDLCGKEGAEWIDQGVGAGWLHRDGSRVAFTTSGFLLSTELISQLF